jgi:hypothetical protein
MCFSSHILAFALHCKGVLGIVLVCSECVCMHMRDGSGSGSGG